MRIEEKSRFKKLYGESDIIEKFVAIVNYDKVTQNAILLQFNSMILMFINFNVFEEAIPVVTTTYIFDSRINDVVKTLLHRATKMKLEDYYFSHYSNQSTTNMTQLKLDQIMKIYQNEVDKSFAYPITKLQ